MGATPTAKKLFLYSGKASPALIENIDVHVQAYGGVSKLKSIAVISTPEPRMWNQALNYVENLQDLYGKDKVDIEIVAYGPGIGMLRDDAVVANRVAEAVKSGISVVACENTMTAQKLDKTAMNPSVSYVPAGVVQLMNRQNQGWAYIRP